MLNAVAVPERVKQYMSVTKDKAANCKINKDQNHEPKAVLAKFVVKFCHN